MTEPTRWVVIDNGDARVEYSGIWHNAGGEQYNNRSDNGETYRNSLQSTSMDGSNLSFSFRGNAARIRGTTDLLIDSAGVPDPDWDCMLDGKVIRREEPVPFIENNRLFCESDALPGGDHTIGLTVRTKGRSFWLDCIEYRTTDTIDNEVMRVSSDDADISYHGDWAALRTFYQHTLTKGSSVTFSFIGSGVSLYGIYVEELPHANGQAAYSIDGGPSTIFTIPGGGDASVYNRKIFEVSGLRKQAHTIVVTYVSAGNCTPLVVTKFLVEGGTNLRVPASGSGSSVSGSSTASAPSDTASAPNVEGDSSSNRAPLGTIVGSVLGAVAGLLLLFLIAWYWRQRRSQPLHSVETSDQPFALTREGQPELLSARPIATHTNHRDSPPPPQAPIEHPAARRKLMPTPVAAPSESSHANSSSPLTPSRGIFHEDSGVRIQGEASDAIPEFPPLYTVS